MKNKDKDSNALTNRSVVCPHCNSDTGTFYQKTTQESGSDPRGYWYCVYCGFREYEFSKRAQENCKKVDWSKTKGKKGA